MSSPRILIIGAGSRGTTYARAIIPQTRGIIAAIAEPIPFKRQQFGSKFIWGTSSPVPGQSFTSWSDFLSYELGRRERESNGEKVERGVDAVFICVLDELHKEVVVGLAPLKLHVLCEKPLATRWADCVEMWRALMPHGKEKHDKMFSICHVLRYSAHNVLLRKLLLEERVVGDILSVNHTEPVGWWHFTHSYVRGNWRKESTTAPSLLTKSCHDIDFILWLLCSPPPGATAPAHLPSTITSTGSLQYFTKSRKPTAADNATNCLSCPIEKSCKYSAKKIYVDSPLTGVLSGKTGWPVKIVLPEIEELVAKKGVEGGAEAMLAALSQDYPSSTPQPEIDKRNWFGRCVYESSNDVCDEQVVTLIWDDDPSPLTQANGDGERALRNRGAKTATFHMTAHTKKICDRYTHIYGADGEIYADGSTITIEDFRTGETKTYHPPQGGVVHGGGDEELVKMFVEAVEKVESEGWEVERAQRVYLGCTLEEVMRSHAVVFAAEGARRERKVVDFGQWWEREVEGGLKSQDFEIGSMTAVERAPEIAMRVVESV